MRKGFTPVVLLVVIVVIIVAALVAWYVAANSRPKQTSLNLPPVACTQEAKQCPDGSYVGRTGPDCAFAACPNAVASTTATSSAVDTSNWQKYTNPTYGYSFEYPAGYSFSDNTNHTWQNIDSTSSLGLEVNVGMDDTSNEYGTTTQAFIDEAAGINNADQNQASSNLGSICDAGGPNGSDYCDRIDKQTSFINSHGITCYELYLQYVENESSHILGNVGPLYACDITHQTQNMARALLITPWEVASGKMLSSQEIASIKAFINTIQFIQPSSTVDTANWKIYSNQQYGFSVKYPPFISSSDITTDQTDNEVDFTTPEYDYLYGFIIYPKSAATSLTNWFLQQYDQNNLLLSSGAYKVTTVNGSISAIQAQQGVPLPDSYTQGFESDAMPFLDDIYMLSPDGKEVVAMDTQRQIDWWDGFGFDDPFVLQNEILSTFQFASSTQGAFCGGIATGAFPCPAGYSCQLNGTYPDAGGHCVQQATTTIKQSNCPCWDSVHNVCLPQESACE